MNPRKPVGKAIRACVSAQPLSLCGVRAPRVPERPSSPRENLSLCGAGAPRRQARAERAPHTRTASEVVA